MTRPRKCVLKTLAEPSSRKHLTTTLFLKRTRKSGAYFARSPVIYYSPRIRDTGTPLSAGSRSSLIGSVLLKVLFVKGGSFFSLLRSKFLLCEIGLDGSTTVA